MKPGRIERTERTWFLGPHDRRDLIRRVPKRYPANGGRLAPITGNIEWPLTGFRYRRGLCDFGSVPENSEKLYRTGRIDRDRSVAVAVGLGGPVYPVDTRRVLTRM